MINTKFIRIWSCWLLVFVQNVQSSLIRTQLMSFCNQTLHMSSSLSIIFTPLSYSSCCNVTLVPFSSNSSEEIVLNINQMSIQNSSLRVFDQQMRPIEFHNYSNNKNRTLFNTNAIHLPIVVSLCRFDIPAFELLITNLFKGPCLTNHFRCLTTNQDQWCIDEQFHCDGYHSCPQGTDELTCSKSMSRYIFPKMKRTIRGGVVTTIIIFGLLLIFGSVSIAAIFVYNQRKRQRRRQFTYSLESTSDEWEPSGTGYHLFDNWPTNRRNTVNNIDSIINDTNEHIPITATTTNR